VIEGTPEMLWGSLLKLRALPDDTRVYCGHEYTQANIRFAKTIEPDNPAWKPAPTRSMARQPRHTDHSGHHWREKAANPFLRADRPEVAAAVGMPGRKSEEVFAEIRARKNKF